MQWADDFRNHVSSLMKEKDVYPLSLARFTSSETFGCDANGETTLEKHTTTVTIALAGR